MRVDMLLPPNPFPEMANDLARDLGCDPLCVPIPVLVCCGQLVVLLIALFQARGSELVIASTYNDGTVDANGMLAAHKTLPFGSGLTLTRSSRRRRHHPRSWAVHKRPHIGLNFSRQ